MNSKRSPVIPIITVCIWGSLYIASGIVLKQMSTFLLLFLRFFISSLLLIAIGFRNFQKIRKEDWKSFLFIGFYGYFLSNAALMLGIQYSTSSFSSLINATSPVVITLFAVWILKEQIHKKDVISLALSIVGAAVVIGSPVETPSAFGVACCIFSVLLWSYVTIHIKKLTAIYPPIEVTAICMAIASVFAAPASFAYYKITGDAVHFSTALLFPVIYICLICTAFSHYLWNLSLQKYGALYCASFYPLQPIVSVLLGIILMHEPITVPFLIGLVLIIAGLFIATRKSNHRKPEILPGRKSHII